MRRRSVAAAVGAGSLVAGLLTGTPAGAAVPAAVPRVAAAAPVTGAATEALPPVDVAGLDMVPVVMDGVVNADPARTSTSTITSLVWAVRQAGTRIFVGGMFLDVQQGAAATPVRQSFLAAFDAETGRWDPTCRPTFDNAVYALAVLPSGDLAVGGEFTRVNGAPRQGVVALDPATCTVASLPTQVARPYSTARAVVRDLDVVGGRLYIAGNFSRVVGPAQRGYTITVPPDAPPADAVECTTEGRTCVLPADTSYTMWYGAGTRWALGQFLTGSVACTNATFGDPAPGTAKRCLYKAEGRTRTSTFKVTRVDATTGAVDSVWKPEVTGSGVWGLSVDAASGRVHLAGYFSGVNGRPDSGNYAVVDGTTGASVTGLVARPRNSTARTEVYDTETGVGSQFVGGSEHVLQTLDLATGRQTAFSTTGMRDCFPDNFRPCNGYDGGGDFQVVQRIGGTIFAGCHCTYDTRFGRNQHYSSLTRTRTAHKHVMAYDATTGALQTGFRPDIDGAVDGAWAVGSDTRGCLYIGGDYTRGGTAAGRSRYVQGIARFCPRGAGTPVQPPAPGADTVAPTAVTRLEGSAIGDGAVQLAWTAATDAVGVVRYRVTRTGAGATDTTGTLFTSATGLPAGPQTFTVAAVDAAGNVGPGTSVTVTVGAAGGADTAAPTAPTGLAAAAAPGGGVALTWRASSDAVGVKSYLVYRNGAYVGWSATTAWTDATAPRGTALTYQLRATDAANNRSVRSEAAVVTLP